MKLEEYHTAKVALEIASLSLANSRFVNLIKECDKLIAGDFLFFLMVKSSLFN